VKAELGRLVAALREIGTGAPESIRDQLARLEHEKRELQDRPEELEERKRPLDQVMALGEKLINNWPGVGDLLKQATGDEQRIIIEQHAEVIQLTPTATDGKPGTYVPRLFPELTPNRDTGNSALLVQASPERKRQRRPGGHRIAASSRSK
jgi:cell division septum initiation protein DivIVA